MISRLCLLPVLALMLAPLRGQEGEPVHMRPEFPLVFPLVNDGDVVSLKFPVLINQTTVVKPGMQLRVLYVLSRDAGGSSNLAAAHEGNLEQSYARNAFGANGSTDRLPPELAHEIEGYRRTVWTVPNNFMLAMAQYPTEVMHLIYSPTGKYSDLDDQLFSFFDGLFLGSPSGKVTVIAVEKNSIADKAGVKAGDEITAVGTYPTHDDLKTFASAYAAAKRDAKDNEVSTYALTLRGAGGAQRMANLAMPMRIRGGLMDGFSTKP